MKILHQISTIVSLCFLSACYTMNPDGTIDIPQKNIKDIAGEWVGFTQYYFFTMSLTINEDNTGFMTISTSKESETSEVTASIENNIVRISPVKKGDEEWIFKGKLDPTFMIISMDVDSAENAQFPELELIQKSELLKKLNIRKQK